MEDTGRQPRAGLNENILKLSLQGYRIALDGYGNGYLNTHLLSDLKISSVRLDKRFVSDMKNESGEEILRGMITMLKNIGLSVVVPGIDDEETKDKLIHMGCDYMMGKLFVEELP